MAFEVHLGMKSMVVLVDNMILPSVDEVWALGSTSHVEVAPLVTS